MFSCLWQIWEWIDPSKMDKIQKAQTSSSNTENSSSINNESSLIQHHHQIIHQHGPPPPPPSSSSSAHQYYPIMHQHSQIFNNNKSHHLHHPLQSPLLLNVNNHQQMQQIHSTAHRHFQQHYPSPYGINNSSIINNNNDFLHQHHRNNLNPQQQQQQQQQQNQNIIIPQHQEIMPKQQQQQQQEIITKEVQVPPQVKIIQASTNAKFKTKEGDKNKQLRSPSARRPPNAPVTMQGWLHKQGSEGLMLWKKRWFVLSEYCLFYYKGLEEEKLLGSILLPSYKVSVCGSEDKINRKFSFKCEHANMRTYILAADSQELMMQWIHVLNLACNLQSNFLETLKDRTPQQSSSSTTESTMNNNNSKNMQLNFPIIHNHTASNTTDLSNSSQQELNQYNQPVYANAPPKPRRMADGGYCSPGPEIERNFHFPIGSKSPCNTTNNSYYATGSRFNNNNNNNNNNKQHEQQIYNNERGGLLVVPHQNIDRRTPDTYARSNLSKYRNPSDYEDIYTEQHQQHNNAAYKRPLSPVAPDNLIKKGYPSVNVGYIPPSIVQKAAGYAPPPPMEMLRTYYQQDQIPIHRRLPPVQTISRPHSADFLEYKSNKLESAASVPSSSSSMAQQTRPKSSLDINMYSNNKECDSVPRSTNYLIDSLTQPHHHHNKDNDYFYSQERYAEKMRKSAQYLQKMPVRYQQQQQQQQVADSSSTSHNIRKRRERNDLEVPNNHYGYNNSSSLFRDDPSSPIPNLLPPVRSRSALSESSLLCAQDIENEISTSRGDSYYNENLRSNNQNNPDQFIRSASARLAQSTNTFEENMTTRIEGERKREESMKRLLEWKQRMLQSPLNRKAQAQAYRGYLNAKENAYVYQNCTLSSCGDKKSKKNQSASSTASGRRSVQNLVQYNSYSSDDEASGSISINTKDATLGRDTFPRGMANNNNNNNNNNNKRSVTPNIMQNAQQASRSATNLDKIPFKYDKNFPIYPTWQDQPQHHNISTSNYGQQYHQDMRSSQNELAFKNKLNVSAGELLGRTHEELVLLLIQLRRQQAQTFQAIESCYNEIDVLQLRMRTMDQLKRMENLQKLERIKQNLIELEKQYEKRKPLVNLVDNMVKLGSLYRHPNEARQLRERLEFNQYVQERRLLADEKRDWNRIEPNHLQLQEKVRQLYQLDGLIQEESRNLHNLQRNKEDIERALSGLRNRLLKGLNNPEEIEQARRQQFILENELSRVHLMLAQNSNKLEETVAGNARLEQELLVLKQKLQNARQQRNSPQLSNAGDSLPYLSSSNQNMETDLERVQKKIGDLQKQREELSMQVRQLTDRSNTPSLIPTKQTSSAPPSSSSSIDNNNSANLNFLDLKKNKPSTSSSWRETDLDTMNSIDHGYDSYSSTSTTPLYIITDSKNAECYEKNPKTSDSTISDDTANSSSNLFEKQEIKTVRIVKRESERRQRDREKTFNGKCDTLLEEDDSSARHPSSSSSAAAAAAAAGGSSALFRPTSLPQPFVEQQQHHHCSLHTTKSSSTNNNNNRQKTAQLSPVFKSEAAKQIITEVSKTKKSPSAQKQRRAVPKEHRRHHTAPNNDNLLIATLGNLDEGRRARDDLDIERALRQRIDAPDLVRSTLSNKELKYNEQTIDNLLSTPNKILIPERYIPEQMPQPSEEEQEKRKKKVESIKKMLSDTAIISTTPATSMQSDDKTNIDRKKLNSSGKSASTSSILEEKKQREHLLQLNQILAKQVMEMSKAVAVKNMEALKFAPTSSNIDNNNEDEDSSPVAPLPLYQQRENYYS